MNSSTRATDGATPVSAIILVCSAAMTFSALDTTAKYLGTLGFEPPFISWARFAVHAAMAFLVLQPWRRRTVLSVRSLPWQIVRGATLFGATFLNFVALRSMQLVEVMSIFFFAPMVITALAGPLLGEWAGWRRWAAIMVGLVGVLIITRPGFGAFGIGHACAMGSMLCYCAYVIMTRKMSATETPESLIFYSALTPTILMLPAVPVYGSLPDGAFQWILILSLGFYGGLGHWLLIKAYSIATASSLAPYPYVQMVGMAIFGYVVFRDVPDGWTVVGAAIIVASGLYLLHRERQLRLQTAASALADPADQAKSL